jgi:hypothetical protein
MAVPPAHPAVTNHGRGMVFSWLPGLQAARSYRREWLAKDILESAVTAFRQQTGAEWTTADQATDHLT